MKRLWLIRHGPTHSKNFVGWTDLPADLSDHAQISNLNAALPDAPVRSSDLTRAVTTADRLSKTRYRHPHDPDWREMHLGAWENLSFDEIEARHPDQLRPFLETPGAISAPDGESWDRLCQRIGAAMQRCLEAPEDDQIIVAHLGAISAALHIATGIPARTALSFSFAPLGVTQLMHHGEGAWGVGFVNRVYK